LLGSGDASTKAGVGGTGIASSISGTVTTYGGGGAGSSSATSYPGGAGAVEQEPMEPQGHQVRQTRAVVVARLINTAMLVATAAQA
jgi:hypothetical protein